MQKVARTLDDLDALVPRPHERLGPRGDRGAGWNRGSDEPCEPIRREHGRPRRDASAPVVSDQYRGTVAVQRGVQRDDVADRRAVLISPAWVEASGRVAA